ncbi:MAG: surface-adhesin E family protein [Betaproteobacteria bacterium]|jgi:hypothetical protein
MKKFFAIAALAFSSVAAAETDWIVIPTEGAGRAFLDRASFVEGANTTDVTVLRSYDDKITLGEDAQTGVELYPHRSAKVRYAVDCAARKVGMESWELYSGNLGDGKIVWADRESGPLTLVSPKSAEERIAFNAVCSQDAALRQVVRRLAQLGH